MAKAELESTYEQPGPPVASEVVWRSRWGRVTSLATTTTNWASRVHWTVTGDKKKSWQIKDLMLLTNCKQHKD